MARRDDHRNDEEREDFHWWCPDEDDHVIYGWSEKPGRTQRQSEKASREELEREHLLREEHLKLDDIEYMVLGAGGDALLEDHTLERLREYDRVKWCHD